MSGNDIEAGLYEQKPKSRKKACLFTALVLLVLVILGVGIGVTVTKLSEKVMLSKTISL
jgi:hypothetical protein